MSAAVPLIVEDLDSKSLPVKRRPLGRLDVISSGKKIKLPLAAVDIKARVADRLAYVTISQKFHNPFSDHLEAVYIFPLSGGCAVSAFQMKVGERIVEGKVFERQQARAEYAQALEEGRRAALMEQERENVFTVQVGNLPPGEEVTIVLSYSEKLPYFDQGTTELRLPLVVAPRYVAGSPLERESVGDGVELDTDQVPDASRISPPRLVDGVEAMVALSISVTLESEAGLADLACSQHANRLAISSGGIVVSLLRDDELINRDFVLRWRLADDKVRSKFLIYKDSKSSCYGMLSLVPPRADDIARPSRDVLFVVDRSGSMQGVKMISAARACSFLISTLGPEDRYAIQVFDDQFDWLKDNGGERFFDADEEGMLRANDFLRGVQARGGTCLYEALVDAIAAMEKRSSKTSRLPVIVILTDGEVSNEPMVYKHIQNSVSDIRLFTVGIDTAVNDAFLRRLASLGGGTSSFVAPGVQLEDALTQVGREIGTPLVTDLVIEDLNCDLDNASIAPGHLADLFEGRAVNVFFRLSAAKLKDLAKAKIKVCGKYEDGQKFVSEVTAQSTEVAALPQLWARAYVTELEDRYRVARASEQTELKKEIIALAIEHTLLTKFTAFLAVDRSEIVNADGTVRKVVQPVAMPAAWDPSATSQGRSSAPGAAAAMPSASVRTRSAWGAPPPQPTGLIGGHLSAGGFGAAPAQSAAADWGGATDGWGAAPSSSSQPVSSSFSSSSVPPVPPSAAPNAGAPLPPGPQSPPPAGNGVAGWAARPREIFDALRKNISAPFQSAKSDDEIDRIFNGLGAPAEKTEGSSLSPQSQVALLAAFEQFSAALQAVLASIASGHLPDVANLEKYRATLLLLLNQSELSSSADLLQKYLKADLPLLLAALASAKSVSPKLKAIGSKQAKMFDAASEADLGKIRQESKPFWEVGV